MNLDTNQIASDFHESGFTIVRSLFSRDEIANIEQEIQRFIEHVAPTLSPGRIYYEDAPGRPVKAIHGMNENSQFFTSLMIDHRLLKILRGIWTGGDIMPESVMFFGKPAGDGSETPAHQDNAFQCWDPPLALTATLAIDESTPQNGALACQRGSHQVGLLPHRQSGVMGFSRTLISSLPLDRYPEVQLCMRPGDLALHQVNTIHRSGANRSTRSRRQLGIGYRSSLATRDEAAWQDYQQQVHALHQANTIAAV
jgi:ectoine hydroxylase-related dioxygenase (phytanoyl-CoA dioxygenase family)